MLSKTRKQLLNAATTYLTANYGTSAITHFIQKYGEQGITHRTILKNVPNMAIALHDVSLGRHIKHLHPFTLASNLYTSYFHMQNVRRSAINNICKWLLSIVTLSRMYSHSLTVQLFTVLFTLKDSRLSTTWKDETNGKNSYKLLTSIYSILNHQISNNKSLNNITILCHSNELPYHLTTTNYSKATIPMVYGHPHEHFLLAVTDPRQLKDLKDYVRKDFHKICGYNPLSFHIQPLVFNKNHKATLSTTNTEREDHNSLIAVIKFVKYMLTDYHLETKDCPSVEVFKQLPPYLRHLIIACQLQSTKSQNVNHYLHCLSISQLLDTVNTLKLYKFIKINQSINGCKKLLVSYYTPNNEAIHRFYISSHYLNAHKQNLRQAGDISLFKEGRGPAMNNGKGTTSQNLLKPVVDFKVLPQISKNKKKYINTS